MDMDLDALNDAINAFALAMQVGEAALRIRGAAALSRGRSHLFQGTPWAYHPGQHRLRAQTWQRS